MIYNYKITCVDIVSSIYQLNLGGKIKMNYKICGYLSVLLALFVSMAIFTNTFNISITLIGIITISSVGISMYTLFLKKKYLIPYLALLINLFNVSYITLLFFGLG